MRLLFLFGLIIFAGIAVTADGLRQFDGLETFGLYGHLAMTLPDQKMAVSALASIWRSDAAYFVYLLTALAAFAWLAYRRWDRYQEHTEADKQMRLYALGLENMGEGFCVLDHKAEITFCNLVFREMFFGGIAEVKGEFGALLALEKHRAVFDEGWQLLLTQGEWSGVLWLRGSQRRTIPMECRAARVEEGEDNRGTYMVLLNDISERLNHEQQLEFLANYDVLTGLPNRNLLNAEIKRLVGLNGNVQSPSFAVMFMDVDRFKNINDSLSHYIGDQLLRELAGRLKELVGERGFVARLGGDEFVILMKTMAEEFNPIAVAKDVIHLLDAPILLEDKELYLSMSIGVSIYPEDGDDPGNLLRKSDIAMYCIKAKGGNGYAFYSESMNQQSIQDLKLESDIRRALQNDEFVVYYQPKVNMIDGSLIGYEALVRWASPQDGLISPALFIDVAERTGSIIKIGMVVIEKVCQQIALWSKQDHEPLPVAINVSPQQLMQPDFVDQALAVIARYKISPQLVEFEITEGMVVENMETCISQLATFRGFGHKIYIDDFGTGYSSLSYLQKLPIDVLKIDQSFVKDVVENEDQQSIVKTIVDLAHNLRLLVVAEGVEDEATQDYLCSLGCTAAQGYFYARPLEAEDPELLALIAKHDDTSAEGLIQFRD